MAKNTIRRKFFRDVQSERTCRLVCGHLEVTLHQNRETPLSARHGWGDWQRTDIGWPCYMRDHYSEDAVQMAQLLLAAAKLAKEWDKRCPQPKRKKRA